jgi:hypothetical protein
MQWFLRTICITFMQSYESFIQKTKRLLQRCQESETITLGEIQEIFGYSSHYILILFLTIPFLQPVPIPGLSTFFGLVIMLSSFCIIVSRKLYIPKFLRLRTLSTKNVIKIISFLLNLSGKVERWLHPRGKFMNRFTVLRKINGILLLIAGIVLALPLPIPLTNMLPAYSIATICLGSLKEDGLFVGIGWLLFSVSIFYILILTHYSMEFITVHIPLTPDPYTQA